jgi:hypothetical protein
MEILFLVSLFAAVKYYPDETTTSSNTVLGFVDEVVLNADHSLSAADKVSRG